MREPKAYTRVNEAEDTIKKMCEKYKDVFWAVRPEMVAVMGVENKQRGEKAVAKNPYYAKLRTIDGPQKKLLADSEIPTRYIIELYWSDWNEWKESERQWVLAEQILQIGPDVGTKIQPDCQGFRILLLWSRQGLFQPLMQR